MSAEQRLSPVQPALFPQENDIPTDQNAYRDQIERAYVALYQKRLRAWLGQAQPLLYYAKALVTVYSSGWACPSHAKQAQIRKIIEQKGTIKVAANFVPIPNMEGKKKLEN